MMRDGHIHPLPSNDQVEESTLGHGLDITSKAWQVSKISLIREGKMGPLTGPLSDSIRGALYVLWMSPTGKWIVTSNDGNKA